MKYTQTKPNQLVAEKKRCHRCGKTGFRSLAFPGKWLCADHEQIMKEEAVFHKARQRNERLKKATKTRNRRGSNQYQVKHKNVDRLFLALMVLLFAILLFGVLTAIFSPMKDDRSLSRKAEAMEIISPLPTVLASAGIAVTPTPPADLPSPEGEVADFLNHVHTRESSRGQNPDPNALHNRCKAKGMSNEYGYGGMALGICFKTHEEATARVARWYQEHRATRTEAQTYCYYNLGKSLDTCHYWEVRL